MSIGLVTVAALLLLLPGIGFIAGVNVADKNVREIVFRNTPAEIGYVIIVSGLIHLIFIEVFPHFSAAQIYASYRKMDIAKDMSLDAARSTTSVALAYFLLTAFAGVIPGLALGRAVRRGGRWRFFAKHRWMLDLVANEKESTINARVVVNPKFTVDTTSTEHVIVVEGILRDSYFASDGTLLYLVFSSFTELSVPLASPPVVGQLISTGQVQLTQNGQLVIEGRQVIMAWYIRLPLAAVTTQSGLSKIEMAVRRAADTTSTSD